MSGEKKVTMVSATQLGKPSPRIQRVAAYCRVSTLSDEQSTSIEAQIDYYQNMICNHSGCEFVDIYSDRHTGRNTRKRKGFQRLLDDCRAGEIDLVLTKSISRLGRDTVLLLQTVQELKNMNVDMFFETENLYLHNPKAMLMITILGSLAQEESRGKSDNIKWGIRYSFKSPNTKYLNRPCYGYRPGPGNTLEIEPFEANVIRLIYQLCIEGQSLRAIGRQLQNMGVRSPRGGERWSPETLRYILTNEKYKGDVRLQKTHVNDFFSGKQKKNDGELEQYYFHEVHVAIIVAEDN